LDDAENFSQKKKIHIICGEIRKLFCAINKETIDQRLPASVGDVKNK